MGNVRRASDDDDGGEPDEEDVGVSIDDDEEEEEGEFFTLGAVAEKDTLEQMHMRVQVISISHLALEIRSHCDQRPERRTGDQCCCRCRRRPMTRKSRRTSPVRLALEEGWDCLAPGCGGRALRTKAY